MSDEYDADVPATLEELRQQLKRLREQENTHYTEIMLKLQDIHDAVEASVTDQVSGLYDEAVGSCEKRAEHRPRTCSEDLASGTRRQQN